MHPLHMVFLSWSSARIFLMENLGATVYILYLSIPFYSAQLFLQNSNLHSYRTSISQVLPSRIWYNLGHELSVCFRQKITESTVSRAWGWCQNAEGGIVWLGQRNKCKVWSYIVPRLHVTKNFWELTSARDALVTGWLIWGILSLYRSSLNRTDHWWNSNYQ